MTNRTASRSRRPAPPPPPKRVPVLALALGALALVLAFGFAIALVGGDDDDGGSDGGNGGSSPTTEVVFGSVSVDGTPLTTFDPTVTDPAVGAAAPVLAGETLGGTPVDLGAGAPTLVVFLAHWCPHCQAELPILVELADAGTFEGVRTVAVLTGTNPEAPNFPPAAWLAREGWGGEVLVDDEDSTAAAAYGLAGYPFLVALDANGDVVGRTSGEQPAEAVAALADAARGGPAT